jgi:hypothetical protein
MTTTSPRRPAQLQPSTYSDLEASGNRLLTYITACASDRWAADGSAAKATSVLVIEDTRHGSAENVVIEDRGAVAAMSVQVGSCDA